jgi:hypothetical protein
MQPDMGDNLCAAHLHHHWNCAVTVHLASALPTRVLKSSTNNRIPGQAGTSADRLHQPDHTS